MVVAFSRRGTRHELRRLDPAKACRGQVAVEVRQGRDPRRHNDRLNQPAAYLDTLRTSGRKAAVARPPPFWALPDLFIDPAIWSCRSPMVGAA